MIESAEDVATMIEDFGDPIEVAGLTTHAVFGARIVDVPSDDSSVVSSDSSAIVTAAIAELVADGATLVHINTTYRVAFQEPDRSGLAVRLILEKVTV